MYRYILFDLDGTLLDTFVGVSRSVSYALEYFGKPVPRGKEMLRYLGPPLIESFQKLAGMSKNEAEAAVKKFRERYETAGVYEYGRFEDIKGVLSALREKGCTLAVATAKLEDIAKIMLEHAALTEEFAFIGGSARTEDRISKSQVIAYVLENLGNPDKEEVLMVGDRENDVLGAKENGIACCGLLCGYGSREELEKNGADHIVNFAADILQLI